jgi:hypothetical protein
MADDVPQQEQRTNVSMKAQMASRAEAVIAAMGGDASPEASKGDAKEVTETPLEQTTTETVEQKAVEETPEQADARARAEARNLLFNEKLKTQREKTAALRIRQQAKAEARALREQAAKERETAAAEREKWERIGRDGSYLDTLKELGRDPRAEWEKMNREAIEASTPEAQAKRDREALRRELSDEIHPLKEEIAKLRAEREELSKQAEAHRLQTSFTSTLGAPEFKDLRIEYGDEQLLDHIRALIKAPEVLYETAKKRNVQLTDPEKGFTMQEILRVLAAEQAAHNAGKQTRAAAMSPPEPQSGQPTVNGTAPRRNAGTAVGNDLASQRASAKAADLSGLSIKERVRRSAEAEIRRHSGG